MALCLKNPNAQTFIISKNVHHHLISQYVLIFLVVEDLALMLRLLTDQGAGC